VPALERVPALVGSVRVLALEQVLAQVLPLEQVEVAVAVAVVQEQVAVVQVLPLEQVVAVAVVQEQVAVAVAQGAVVLRAVVLDDLVFRFHLEQCLEVRV
jgi:hypothetical protein